jgi:hypothetical protein
MHGLVHLQDFTAKNPKMADFFFKNWAEFLFFVLIIIGFIISIAAPSAVISYTIIFIVGLMSGRLLYERKNKLAFPYVLIVIGFIIGYILGAFYGNKLTILTLYLIGIWIGYQIFDKGIIHDLKI